MRRFVAAELWHRRSRTLALLVGIVVATTSFTVLTGASQSQRLQVRGTVTKSFRSAYDVLVRPRGARTGLEQRTGRVQPNFLSGLFGGITMREYRAIRDLPGVDVAAPVANLGYVMPATNVQIDLGPTPAHRTLLRVRQRWVSDRGLTRAGDRSSYVYSTPRRFGPANYAAGFNVPSPRTYFRRFASLTETGRQVCPDLDAALVAADSAFARERRARFDCYSRTGGWRGGPEEVPGRPPRVPRGHIGTSVEWAFPFLLTAIDPVAEARLAGLDRAVISGRYLRGSDRAGRPRRLPYATEHTVPVLAASRTLLDQRVDVTAERLPSAQRVFDAPSLPPRVLAFLDRLPRGPARRHVRVTAASAYARLLDGLRRRHGPFVSKYWTVGPTRYDGGRAPEPKVRPPVDEQSEWQVSAIEDDHYVKVAPEARDTQFRPVAGHDARSTGGGSAPHYDLARLSAVGVFDPARVTGSDARSALPLETYAPAAPAGRTASARAALGDRTLGPSGNLGGYVGQPPLLLTTLQGAAPLLDPAFYDGAKGAAPISAVRVRVAGVRGPDAVSRERIRQAAERIAGRTGLVVDITVGSSGAPTGDRRAGRAPRPARAGADGAVGEEGRRDEHPARGRSQERAAVRADPGGLRAVRRQRGERRRPRAAHGARRARLARLAGLAAVRPGAGGARSDRVRRRRRRRPAGAAGRGRGECRRLGGPRGASRARGDAARALGRAVPAWRASRATPIAAIRPAVSDAGRARRRAQRDRAWR